MSSQTCTPIRFFLCNVLFAFDPRRSLCKASMDQMERKGGGGEASREEGSERVSLQTSWVGCTASLGVRRQWEGRAWRGGGGGRLLSGRDQGGDVRKRASAFKGLCLPTGIGGPFLSANSLSVARRGRKWAGSTKLSGKFSFEGHG